MYDSERAFLRRTPQISIDDFLLVMDETCLAVKRHMNLLSLTLKQQLRSCAGSLERLKMWKIKPGI